MNNIQKRIDQVEENIIKSNSELAYSFESSTKKVKIDDSKSISDELNNIIGNFSMASLRNCLLFYLSFKEKKDIELLSYNRFFNKHLKMAGFQQQDIIGSILSTLDLISSLGYLEYTVENNVMKIINFSDELKDALIPHIAKEDEYSDMSDGIYFGTVYEFFKTMD